MHWLRMPLPFALNHINLYLLDDGDGWVLVDTGIKSDISYDLWRKHFEVALEGRPEDYIARLEGLVASRRVTISVLDEDGDGLDRARAEEMQRAHHFHHRGR